MNLFIIIVILLLYKSNCDNDNKRLRGSSSYLIAYNLTQSSKPSTTTTTTVTTSDTATQFGKNRRKEDEEEIQQDNKQANYDFIFGFSTGHAGTTTLSLKDYYLDPKNILFLHEMKYGPSSYPYNSQYGYSTEAWQKGDQEKDYTYVKDVFFPFLLKSRTVSESTVVLDLGHHNLYFIDSLIKYMNTETKYKYIIVRIRRERLELAVSLSFHNPKFPIKDICKELVTRYCPYDREDEVILKPPSRDIWDKFTVTQKAFWIMDETEARWNKLVNEHPHMERLEIYWSKSLYGQSSMDAAALKIAKVLNLEGIAVFNESWQHVKDHIHSGSNLFTKGPDKKSLTMDEVKLLDLQYQKMMQYQYMPA